MLCEVALGETLALGDHAEAVGAGGLGRARVLEDLLRGHHRVHRRVRLREARLGAEAAVLGAAARLGVDERAHVGRVAEVLEPGLPRPVDERLDLGVVLDLAQLRASAAVMSGGKLEPSSGTNRAQGRSAVGRRGLVARASARARRGARFSPKARTPSRKSSVRKHDSRSSISSRSTSSGSAAACARSVADDALVAGQRQRRVGSDLGGQVEPALRLELVGLDHVVDEPIARARSASTLRPT